MAFKAYAELSRKPAKETLPRNYVGHADKGYVEFGVFCVEQINTLLIAQNHCTSAMATSIGVAGASLDLADVILKRPDRSTTAFKAAVDTIRTEGKTADDYDKEIKIYRNALKDATAFDYPAVRTKMEDDLAKLKNPSAAFAGAGFSRKF